MAIAESQRQESMLVAQRLADVAELLAQRTDEVEAEDPDPGYMMVTGFQRTTAEVAAACNLSPAAASFMVSHADTLAERLPKVAAVLAVGDTDWRTVQVIITRTEFVADSAMAGLDANLAERISQVALLVPQQNHQRCGRHRARHGSRRRPWSASGRRTGATST